MVQDQRRPGPGRGNAALDPAVDPGGEPTNDAVDASIGPEHAAIDTVHKAVGTIDASVDAEYDPAFDETVGAEHHPAVDEAVHEEPLHEPRLQRAQPGSGPFAAVPGRPIRRAPKIGTGIRRLEISYGSAVAIRSSSMSSTVSPQRAKLKSFWRCDVVTTPQTRPWVSKSGPPDEPECTVASV